MVTFFRMIQYFYYFLHFTTICIMFSPQRHEATSPRTTQWLYILCSSLRGLLFLMTKEIYIYFIHRHIKQLYKQLFYNMSMISSFFFYGFHYRQHRQRFVSTIDNYRHNNIIIHHYTYRFNHG